MPAKDEPSIGSRSCCAQKNQFLGDYRAALALYSAALTDLSFANTKFISPEQFQLEWHRLENLRMEAAGKHVELLTHVEEHGC